MPPIIRLLSYEPRDAALCSPINPMYECPTCSHSFCSLDRDVGGGRGGEEKREKREKERRTDTNFLSSQKISKSKVTKQ